MSQTLQLNAHQIREVAVRGRCSPKTVRKYLDGKPVSGLSEERITYALRLLGYLDKVEVKS
jgi:hypothetical protein